MLYRIKNILDITKPPALSKDYAFGFGKILNLFRPVIVNDCTHFVTIPHRRIRTIPHSNECNLTTTHAIEGGDKRTIQSVHFHLLTK